MKFKHEWKWDWPWEMVSLRDWFYMVNQGYIYPIYFLHVRFFGLRSLWMAAPDNRCYQLIPRGTYGLSNR